MRPGDGAAAGPLLREVLRETAVGNVRMVSRLAQGAQRGGGAPFLQTPTARGRGCECGWSCGCPCVLQAVGLREISLPSERILWSYGSAFVLLRCFLLERKLHILKFS